MHCYVLMSRFTISYNVSAEVHWDIELHVQTLARFPFRMRLKVNLIQIESGIFGVGWGGMEQFSPRCHAVKFKSFQAAQFPKSNHEQMSNRERTHHGVTFSLSNLDIKHTFRFCRCIKMYMLQIYADMMHDEKYWIAHNLLKCRY